jgi:hypothetical protein
VELDDGFACCKPHVTVIKADGQGRLYFDCTEGRHYVSSQLESGSLIGIYAATNGHEHV